MNTLTLDTDWEKRYASWNVTLLRQLVTSGLFIVKTIRLDHPPNVCRRSANYSVFYVNGAKVGLDTWDTAEPSSILWQREMLRDLDLLVKIQWRDDTIWTYMEKGGLRVRPWTVFPSREFTLGFFQYDSTQRHRVMGLISGANRFGRCAYADWTARNPDFTSILGQKIPMDRYLRLVRGCRWGVSLKGRRGTDGKNRREAEFASCGMPLALNYAPSYPFDFRPGRDFWLLSGPEDLITLRNLDPAPFAARSKYHWNEHFSAVGSAKTLLKLVENRPSPLPS